MEVLFWKFPVVEEGALAPVWKPPVEL